ncbi:MAG: HD domain-containing protein [Candidatus Omnitrophica bacterium]|nr:HD domain-containing protein [Candidatus Omnitrophota bacterium]
MLDFSSLYNSGDNKEKPRDQLPLKPEENHQDNTSKKNIPQDLPLKKTELYQDPAHSGAGISFSDINFSQEDGNFNEYVFQNSKQFYLDCLLLAENAIVCLRQSGKVDFVKIAKKISDLTENITFGDKYYLVLMNDIKYDNFLAMDLVNVAILAIEIGIQAGYNRSRLESLALAAFFHDIGLARMQNLINSTRTLTFNEVMQIKSHPLTVKEILQDSGIPDEVINGGLHHHERLDGSGYPAGLKGNQISDFGQIIAVADIFESLTHPRPFRSHLDSLEAFKTIFQTKFYRLNPRYVDALIKSVGFYPLGSWVKLDDGFVGKVVFVDKQYPLRPVILLLFDPSRKSLEAPKRLDMRKHIESKIKSILSPQEVIAFSASSDNSRQQISESS